MESPQSQGSVLIRVASKKGSIKDVSALKDPSQPVNLISRDQLKELGFSRWRHCFRDSGFWMIQLMWTCDGNNGSVIHDFRIKKALPEAIVLGRAACDMLDDLEGGEQVRGIYPTTQVKPTQGTVDRLAPKSRPFANEDIEQLATHDAKVKQQQAEQKEREREKMERLKKEQESNQARQAPNQG